MNEQLDVRMKLDVRVTPDFSVAASERPIEVLRFIFVLRGALSKMCLSTGW